VHKLQEDPGPGIVRLALENDYDLVVLDRPHAENGSSESLWHNYICEHASCAVCLLALPAIQREVVDKTPSSEFGSGQRTTRH
jgi:hypothetical protein